MSPRRSPEVCVDSRWIGRPNALFASLSWMAPYFDLRAAASCAAAGADSIDSSAPASTARAASACRSTDAAARVRPVRWHRVGDMVAPGNRSEPVFPESAERFLHPVREGTAPPFFQSDGAG